MKDKEEMIGVAIGLIAALLVGAIVTILAAALFHVFGPLVFGGGK